MKIQYLGTGAAEGIPAMFCQCETCKKSRRLGGENVRTRSQALIDGKILIDLPADTYMHFLLHNVDADQIRHCLITHSHGDHLYAREMTMRRVGFVELEDELPVTYYGTEAAYEELSELYQTKLASKKDNEKRTQLEKVVPFEPFWIDGYKITPLRANHDAKADPVIYVIEQGNKALLYGHDTGRLLPETWAFLQTMEIRFDLVSLDSTYALCPGEDFGGHMNLHINGQMKDKLLALGLADEHTVFVVNHFSHQNGTHAEIQAEANKLGFMTAYDGMTVEF